MHARKNGKPSPRTPENEAGTDRVIPCRDGSKKMGRVTLEFEVANSEDIALANRGALPPDQIRRLKIKGVVDSGATHMVLPASVANQLGLRTNGKVQVRYAHGRAARRDRVGGVFVEIMGRSDTFSAIVEPSRKDALIGAVVLEMLDFLVDCQHQCLVPRDARTIISEIE